MADLRLPLATSYPIQRQRKRRWRPADRTGAPIYLVEHSPRAILRLQSGTTVSPASSPRSGESTSALCLLDWTTGYANTDVAPGSWLAYRWRLRSPCVL